MEIENEPTYIATPQEITDMRDLVGNLITKSNQSHINLAIDVLKRTLHVMYGSLCIDHPVSRLFNDTNAEYKTFSVFSKCMSDVMVDLKLAKNTRKTAFYALKNVLKKVGFSENFVNRLHLCTEKPLTKYDSRLVLKKKYNRLSDDLPIKKMLTSWITILKTKTKNHSPNTIKIMIAFFLNTCIPALGLCIEILANDVIPVKIDITQKMVCLLCTSDAADE